eukprot:CCRYP_009285-RA/>CCRYP_009285-RA protein AED:0.48 eAED:0.48 QI:0/-1/0/1/-1/1/1/0/80
MGAHTPRITPRSVAVTTRTELLRGYFRAPARKSREDNRAKKSYAQVVARMEKLEKSLKKANKKGKKRRRQYESDSDSDSS